MNANKPRRQPLVYHVCWKDIQEEPLDELAQKFWKIEVKGILPEQNEDRSVDEIAVQTMKKSVCYNGERYQIGLPWKHVESLKKNYFSEVSQLKNVQKLIQKDISLNQNYNQTFETDLDKILSRQSQYGTYLILHSLIKETPKSENSCQRGIKASWWISELKSSKRSRFA